MSNHAYDLDLAELKGHNIYALIEGKIRYAEIWGGQITRREIGRTLWRILLIDKDSMCEPIEDATRYIRASELFLNKKDAQKEIFKRKLKGSTKCPTH